MNNYMHMLWSSMFVVSLSNFNEEEERKSARTRLQCASVVDVVDINIIFGMSGTTTHTTAWGREDALLSFSSWDETSQS